VVASFFGPPYRAVDSVIAGTIVAGVSRKELQRLIVLWNRAAEQSTGHDEQCSRWWTFTAWCTWKCCISRFHWKTPWLWVIARHWTGGMSELLHDD